MDVKLPNLGEGADSGTVVNILVKEGEEIKSGQNLIELENGKAVVAVPSPKEGRVGKLRVKTGDKITVGQVILSLEGADGPPASAEKPGARPTTKPAARGRAPEPEPETEEEAEIEPAETQANGEQA